MVRQMVFSNLTSALARLRLMATGALVLVCLLATDVVAGPHVVVDADTGQVLSHETAHQRWAPASLTKMMTAYVAFHAVRNQQLTFASPVVMSARALANPPTKMGFPYGTVLRLDTAITLIMVKSANDVAHAIAEAVAGNEEDFVALMNSHARRLGMISTQFANPHGLPDAGQYSTAHDLALLSIALHRDFPEYGAFLMTKAVSITGVKLTNYNRLLVNYPGTDGMKTGFVCASGYNVSTSATRNGRRLIAVVLGEPSGRTRNAITAGLLEAAFSKPQIQPGNAEYVRLADIRPMIWGHSRLGDISSAICKRGGRKNWRKDLNDYVEGLESAYYQPEPYPAPIALSLGNATGPNPFALRTAAGNTPEDVLPVPVARPRIECENRNSEVPEDPVLLDDKLLSAEDAPPKKPNEDAGPGKLSAHACIPFPNWRDPAIAEKARPVVPEAHAQDGTGNKALTSDI